jgi:nucleotide-binding universal stress UspA family protein
VFTRILVPFDGSKRAEAVLPYVRRLASTYESNVSLLRAVEFDESTLPVEYVGPMVEVIANEARQKLRDRAQGYLSGIEESFDGVQVDQVVSLDDPVAAITSESSKDFLKTLVAMSTHGRTGIGRLIVGSVTDKVLHGSSNPMLIVRPEVDEDQLERESWRKGEAFSIHIERPDIPVQDFEGTADIQTLIVPLDDSETSEKSLDTAIDLAQRIEAKLLLIRVASSTMQMSMASEWPAGYPDILTAVEDASKGYLLLKIEELKQQGVEKVEYMVLVGDAAANIVETAEQNPNSMIIMTSKGRAGLGRAILGSVADRVVATSTAPVLLVRPD